MRWPRRARVVPSRACSRTTRRLNRRRRRARRAGRVEAVIVVHSRERDDLRGEVAKLQQAWEAESAGLRASLRGAEAQVKSHADDARAAAATHDARAWVFVRECEFSAVILMALLVARKTRFDLP